MIDSHCHLADDAFVEDLEEVLQRAKSAGLNTALCILDTTSNEEFKKFQRVIELWPLVRCATGIHPHRDDVNDVVETVVNALGCLPDPCAVGEIGLDYHYDFAPRELQREIFRLQVQLARKQKLPVVIHSREADDDTVEILRNEGGGMVTGVFHCFTGDALMARRALDLGFYISFSGIVTFKRAEGIRDAAKLVPSDRLLVETDAPYLAPIPHRGKRNEPSWLVRVVDVLAETRQESRDSILAATTSSFYALFGRSS